jgi:hypothetical protein
VASTLADSSAAGSELNGSQAAAISGKTTSRKMGKRRNTFIRSIIAESEGERFDSITANFPEKTLSHTQHILRRLA